MLLASALSRIGVVRLGAAILRPARMSASPRPRRAGIGASSEAIGFAGSSDDCRERDLVGTGDDWGELGAEESGMGASLAVDGTGVGEATSTTAAKVTLRGRGVISGS